MMKQKIAILGAGNIGTAIASGLLESKTIEPGQLVLTRRQTENLQNYVQQGVRVTNQNELALRLCQWLILSVEPHHVDTVLSPLRSLWDPNRHQLISVVSGLSTAQLRQKTHFDLPIARAMPNTAIGIRQSMTCLCAPSDQKKALASAALLFSPLGTTLEIEEELMSSATALTACGIAFFLRMIRAASQGGVEIGFHPETAIRMAAQTAKGAADLLLNTGMHPEFEIDRVTTPRGCTIAGLNTMEHEGLSSAIIKGLVTSSRKADALYCPTEHSHS
jgi:pyrroline-5-carboxylate reductase